LATRISKASIRELVDTSHESSELSQKRPVVHHFGQDSSPAGRHQQSHRCLQARDRVSRVKMNFLPPLSRARL